MNIVQTIYLHISILEEVREYDRKTQSGKRDSSCSVSFLDLGTKQMFHALIPYL